MTPICIGRPTVAASPTLDHLAAFELEDPHSADSDLPACGRDLSKGTGARAGKGVGDGDDVLVLNDGLG